MWARGKEERGNIVGDWKGGARNIVGEGMGRKETLWTRGKEARENIMWVRGKEA